MDQKREKEITRKMLNKLEDEELMNELLKSSQIQMRNLMSIDEYGKPIKPKIGKIQKWSPPKPKANVNKLVSQFQNQRFFDDANDQIDEIFLENDKPNEIPINVKIKLSPKKQIIEKDDWKRQSQPDDVKPGEIKCVLEFCRKRQYDERTGLCYFHTYLQKHNMMNELEPEQKKCQIFGCDHPVEGRKKHCFMHKQIRAGKTYRECPNYLRTLMIDELQPHSPRRSRSKSPPRVNIGQQYMVLIEEQKEQKPKKPKKKKNIYDF